MSSSRLSVFFGTYTPASGVSRGIYAATLDLVTGALSAPALAATTPNPTFLAWRPDGKTIYALGEHAPESAGAKPGGALVAFRPQPDGALQALNIEPTGGGPLAHVGVDRTGGIAIAISYHGGQVASFPLTTDGTLGRRASLIAHTGQLGPNTKRQDKPHPHQATFSPDNRFLYVCDLGLDVIVRYQFDPVSAELNRIGETQTAAGVGPRHCVFSHDGKFLYTINELASTVTVYAADPVTGALSELQSLSTLPAGFDGENICAEIRLRPDERFIYGSNRGHDSVAVFARDPVNGKLTFVEAVPCGGKHPRNFNVAPDGRWLVCANRDTDNAAVFRIAADDGRLTPTGQPVTVPQAVCVLFGS